MTLFERIKFLADKQHKSLKGVAVELGMSENLFYVWKKSKPKGEDLAKVADYFHTSVDYLLGREENPYTESDLEEMAKYSMAFGGKPLTDKDREFIINFLRSYFDSKSDENEG